MKPSWKKGVRYFKILVEKLPGNRPFGKPCGSVENNSEVCLKGMKRRF
jgi:hypothetical protein